MTKIKFYDGKKAIEIEVEEGVIAGYIELNRLQWRLNKQVERHEAAISLTQMQDENGYELADLSAASPLDQIIKYEERTDIRAKLTAALKSLTPEQLRLIKMLKQGMDIREIARALGKDHQSIRDMRERIQKKFKKYL